MDIKKILILVITLLGITIIFPNNSKATKTGFIESNIAPRKYFSINKEKLADITLTIVGSTGIEPDDVKLYEVNSKGQNKKKIEFSSSITSNRKNHIYTLSHSELLKGSEHYFYIEIKDKNGITSKSGFRVYIQTKTVDDKKIQYYSVDDSPRITQILASEKKVYFSIKDIEGIKSVKIQDLNNNNKEITFENLQSGDSAITLDTTKLKSNKEVFNLKIIAQENNRDSGYEQSSEQTISFKLSNEKVDIAPMNLKLDTTVLMLDKNHYNIADLKCTIEPLIVTNDKNITWTSSNTNVATVSNQGKITAQTAGTTTITASTSNGKKAQCEVKVIGQMQKTTQGNGVAGTLNAKGTYWIVKKEKFSKEQLESYINNAEELCMKGDYNKYPEAKAEKIPIFMDTKNYKMSNGKWAVEGKREFITKEKGISATKYLILVTSTNQQISIFEKNSNGKWNLIKTGDTSTGVLSNGGHNRFDFYIGAMYKSYHGTDAIFEFWQCKAGGYKIEGTGGTYDGTMAEPYYAHRALHTGYIDSKNGAPSSSGCPHLSSELKNFIYKNKDMYGTRVIVY